MRFRPNRELFKESIAEMVEVNSMEELRKQVLEPFRKYPIEFKKACFDSRKPWNAMTYYVIVGPSGRRYVEGMSDSDRFE